MRRTALKPVAWRLLFAAYVPIHLLASFWPGLRFRGAWFHDVAGRLPGSLSTYLHFLGYLILTLLVLRALPRWRRASDLPALTLGLTLLAVLTEVAQAFVPGRTPTLWDWACNAAGVLVGMGIHQAWHAVAGWRRRRAETRGLLCVPTDDASRQR